MATRALPLHHLFFKPNRSPLCTIRIHPVHTPFTMHCSCYVDVRPNYATTAKKTQHQRLQGQPLGLGVTCSQTHQTRVPLHLIPETPNSSVLSHHQSRVTVMILIARQLARHFFYHIYKKKEPRLRLFLTPPPLFMSEVRKPARMGKNSRRSTRNKNRHGRPRGHVKSVRTDIAPLSTQRRQPKTHTHTYANTQRHTQKSVDYN